ncbi:MAG: transglutaminase-like domain-containing protein [Lachnospiraceae bacterium]|nr:transglutaminase-like domain-containing protein [Lachnospiraceae bacterium]
MFSFIERIIYKKEKEENLLLVGEIAQAKKSSRLILCLLKGLLIFIASYCTICGLLDAFDISFNKPIVFAGFMFLSLYVALLYMNKFIFYIFYFVLFFGFTIELGRYYMSANSGFQAVINIINNEYSDYFSLLSVREAQEIVTNRFFTVTVAALFMGAFLAILLNVTISGYMNVLETILVTFPFIEIALFIHKTPNPIYLFGLFFVYVSVAFLQFSAHSRMQVKGKHTHEFMRLKTKKLNSYSYQADVPVFLGSFAFSGIISVILLSVILGLSNLPLSKIPGNAIHKNTQEYVKILVQSGFTGFLDRYASTGGLASGRLGGVSQVRPDFETDLNVTFAPNNYETVYLKGFTGSTYISSGWYAHTEDFTEYENTRKYNIENTAKMHVENIDADARFKYIPYFYSGEALKFDADSQNNYDIIYYPINTQNDYKIENEDELIDDPDYKDYVYNICLNVPEYLKKDLDNALLDVNVISHEGLTENEYRLKCAHAIYAYFMDGYSYTMAPGATPPRRDYIEYFINTQKRGFCAHFASTEVMLLRELGIPARYCEGYSIPISTVADNGVLAGEKYDEWYTGENITELNTVITVPVNDSRAHAWVEIYLEGYGFVPFEATIPSFDEENGSNFNLFNFGGLFASLTSNTIDYENLPQDPSADGPSGFSLDVLNFLNFNTRSTSSFMFMMLAVIVLSLTLFFLGKFVIMRVRLLVYKAKNDEYKLVMYEYDRLVKMLRRKRFLTKANPLPVDVKKAYDLYLASYNNTHKKKKVIDTDRLFEYYERIMYS